MAHVSDPARASEVEVRFTLAEHGGTIVLREFDRHGDGWEAYEQAMAAPDGWPYSLVPYADAAAGG